MLRRSALSALLATLLLAAGLPSAQGAISRRVTMTSSSTSVTAGGTVVLKGRVTRSPKGSVVKIQRRSGSAWTTLRSTRTRNARGAYKVTLALSTAGSYTLRAFAPKRKDRKAAASKPVVVTVTSTPPPPPPPPPPPDDPEISTTTLPDGIEQQPYAETLTTQGNATGTWAVTTGSLPAGLNLTGATIGGTPSAAADTTFTVTFTQTSDGDTDTQALSIHVDPAPVAPVTPPVIAAGGDHTCRVESDHTLWCWGDNQKAQLAQPVNLQQPYDPTPSQIGSATNWGSVTLGWDHSCAVRSDYSAWCWGYNFYGEVGDGTTQQKNTPTAIAAGKNWSTIAAGGSATCAITTGGELWCWGYNGFHALGTQETDTTAPVRIGNNDDWVSVSPGANHTCGIRVGGTLWCWGGNGRGQAGVGAASFEVPITQIGVATDWAGVSAGNGFTCAVKTGGTLWCWGRNDDGRVGIGTTGTDVLAPTQVGVATDWATVATGGKGNEAHACGVRTTGQAWCWGANLQGALGNNGQPDAEAAPVQVGIATDWSTASAGTGHTCALKTDGSAYCWGSDTWGQLGNDLTLAPSGVPVPVV
ncbi:MAG TPA: hypothetical protein VLI04_17080 [Nocardioidaceae bacterium]|nr:hypothetical protein [Nocardioidaceae bacterium]